ncbi:MAG: lipoate--protein ligase family protein [Verrucomicrobiia bacterium]
MMFYLDKTFARPEENLACDELLVEFCSSNDGIECLRFWEPDNYFVVLGYGNRVSEEVFVEECERCNVPIFRRISGGGCVLQGPGCLNYSLVLKISNNPQNLSTIPDTNRYVMNRTKRAIQSVLGNNVKVSGITDLTIDGKKFSGNAQRRFNDYILYHGAFLLNMDISMIERLLKIPPRQPCYRQNRTHRDFLININVQSLKIKESLKKEWGAYEVFDKVSYDKINKLAAEKYLNPEWNLKY